MSQFDIPEGSHHVVVGGRGLRWWDSPVQCAHVDHDMCAGCAGLTEAEAAAVREYLKRASS